MNEEDPHYFAHIYLAPEGRMSEERVSRVAVLPYIASGQSPWQWQFLVMKPTAVKSGGTPKFQMAHGKRRVRVQGEWRDLTLEDDVRAFPRKDLEPLFATALREGREEIGLLPENIISVVDMGNYEADTEHVRTVYGPMRVFAVALKSKSNFCKPEEKTKSTAWMVEQEFSMNGRLDHRPVVEDVIRSLDKARSEDKLRHIGFANSDSIRPRQR